MKQGVGEPNSQMGKSYANSALRRANQCSPCALPRDWLAREEGEVEPPGILALPIQVYASWLAPCSYAPALRSLCSLPAVSLGPTPLCVHARRPTGLPCSASLDPPSGFSPKIIKTEFGEQGAVKVWEGRSRQQHSPSIPKSK